MAALRRGAKVILISGPTALQPPSGVEFVAVRTAGEMHEQVMLQAAEAQVVIMSAAVADYRPRAAAGEKIRREGGLTLELEPTSDILAEVGARRLPGQTLIGFAAETGGLLESARRKLAAKKVDAIVANDVSRPGLGFGSDRNVAVIVMHGRTIDLPEMSKQEMAARILDAAVELRSAPAQTKETTKA